MTRIAMTLAVALSLAPLHGVAFAAAPAPAAKSESPCQPTATQKTEAAVMGAMAGAGTAALMKKTGAKGGEVAALVVGAFLTEKIACMLNDKERQQAASATQQAVDVGVGKQVAWTSETRPGVSGKSSVTSETKSPDGSVCRMVRDVVIVDGEETSATKKLCRVAGATGFTLAAN